MSLNHKLKWVWLLCLSPVRNEAPELRSSVAGDWCRKIRERERERVLLVCVCLKYR
ncbi:hypothetical protein Hanom_Chr11g01023481 [Helianthus anomalus]